MDKEHIAIERIKAASEMSLQYFEQPLVITDSGGKDSSVIKELTIRAGVPFEVIHHHTTVDAPETVRFVQSEFKRLEDKGIKCTRLMPTYKGEPTTMWKLIRQKKMPPTRIARYCCQVLKESGGKGRFVATGVRWAESVNRRTRGMFEVQGRRRSDALILNNDNDDRRRLFETCNLKASRIVNPIVDWTEDDVWQFLRDSKVPTNCLYSEGFKRVGCVGCPMASRMRTVEFNRWPKYKNLYLLAFEKMLEARRAASLPIPDKWERPIDVFNWWMEYDVLPLQMSFEELEDA